MRNADYIRVKGNVVRVIESGRAGYAANLFLEYTERLSDKQYWELAGLVHEALKKENKL